jgi:uncharacterized protein YacL
LKVSLSSAEHQPSASLSMVSPPQASLLICSSGTEVSEIIITSRRQQQALQFEQLIFGLISLLAGLLIGAYSSNNLSKLRLSRISSIFLLVDFVFLLSSSRGLFSFFWRFFITLIHLSFP